MTLKRRVVWSFRHFSVYSQLACDVQPGWFSEGKTSTGFKHNEQTRADVILSALQSGRGKLNIYP